jgi:myo-inositol 2-dehydrogenase/D-chiro-inositol 1-dehydrogenase
MTQKIRIAIIGAGRIGYVHAGSVNDNPELELVYVVDPFEENAKKVTAAFGGKVSTDPSAVIASGEIDAVIIGSPTATHIPLLRESIAAGVHALCEKPIDLDIKNVEEFRAQANSAKTNISLGFNRRHDPQYKALKEKVASGAIGTIEQVILTSRDPGPAPQAYIAVSGGIFRDMTIHDFDMARNFVPNIVEVTAFGANSFCDYIKEEGDFDNVSVVMKGANNELVTIVNSRHAAFGYDQRAEVFGDKGMLQISNLTESTVKSFTKDATTAGEPFMDFFLERYADSYRNELKLFVEGIKAGKVLGSTYDDGRAALILADAAHDSARTGKSVKVNLN